MQKFVRRYLADDAMACRDNNVYIVAQARPPVVQGFRIWNAVFTSRIPDGGTSSEDIYAVIAPQGKLT